MSTSTRDFSHLDKLSTEELQEILRQDSLLDDDSSDIDTILYITDLLAKRSDSSNNSKDVEAAWKSFKENYYPYISDPEPLYSFDSPEDKVVKAKPRHLSRAMRTLSVAAVLAVVIISGSVTASAFGYNLWGAVAEWTRDTFGFTQSSQNNGIYPFENLRDALDAMISTNLSFRSGYPTVTGRTQSRLLKHLTAKLLWQSVSMEVRR